MSNETSEATEVADSPEITDVRLLSLKLHNFKGVKDFALDPDGHDVDIFGDNATGKTTLADACWWLLGGKDSGGRSDFEVKRLTEDGSAEHHLDHGVEATFMVGDKKKVMQKVYREKWVKRRGQTDREFDGHTTDHFVDGVPVTAGEFLAIVAEIAPDETMRILTDPYRFSAGLHWKERRQLLLDVCGDVSDEDVISADDELAGLPEILEGRTLNNHRKVVNASRKKVNEELDRIPVRIDEADRALPDTTDLVPIDELQVEMQASQALKYDDERELARIESGGEIAEKTKQLREVEAAIQDARNHAARDEEVQKDTLRERRDGVANKLRLARGDEEDARADSSRADRDIERLTQQMTHKRDEWKKVDEETFSHTEPDTCAACGQALPEEKVEAARQKALEAFNKSKAARLMQLSQDGMQLKGEKEIIEGAAEVREKLMETAASQVDVLTAELEGIDKAIESVQVGADLTKMETTKSTLEAVIEVLREDSAAQVDEVRERITEHASVIEGVQRALEDYKARERGQERIEELKAREKTLACEFERLEHQLYLMDRFIRAKVDLLTDRINARFALARFKLFTILVNGGIEECCEVSLDGVPWGNLNHGAQINVGLDIIGTLQGHYNVALPVWVDQSESVSSLLGMDCQMIRLVVSADDQTMRVEEVAS